MKRDAAWRPVEWLTALLQTAEALAEPPSDGEAKLWSTPAAEEVARFLQSWAEAFSGKFADGEPVNFSTFRSLLERATSGEVVRSPYAGHPRILILGGIEARLATVDRIILGGLNEGTWPAETEPGPWMSRIMRKDFGLPAVERRVGLAAHDFCQAFGKPEVILTRSNLVDGSATVPSRFIRRLQAYLDIIQAKAALAPKGLNFADLARRFDEAKTSKGAPRPRPRPPVKARPTRLSVTDIEPWQHNPYSLYAKRVLRLRAMDPLGGRLDASLRGNVMHDGLEEAMKTFPEAMPPDFAQQLYDMIAGRLTAQGLPEAMMVLWGPRLFAASQWFEAQERSQREAGRKAALLEETARIDLQVAERDFQLICRADRIDVNAAGSIILVDYKTGATPSKKDVLKGLKPQLTLEAAMIRRKAFEGLDAEASFAGLEYWAVNGRNKGGEVQSVALEPAEIEELQGEAWEGLRALIEKFESQSEPYIARVVRVGDFIHLARQAEWEGGRDHGD